MSQLTELEKKGLVECDKCKKLISEFGFGSFHGKVTTDGCKNNVFRQHFQVCVECGKEMFPWLK